MSLVQTSTRIVTAAAVAVTGVVAQPDIARMPAPPQPALQIFQLEPVATRAAAGLAVPQRTTRPFALIGATWTDPRRQLSGTLEVRTRATADGRWTPWQPLEADEPTTVDPRTPHGPDRGGTDPIWVGDSDGVEARIGGGPANRLPEGLRLDLINPDGDRPAIRPAAYELPPSPPVTARTGYQPRPMPSLVTRAGWGANESIVQASPEYTTGVEVLFVHHTADSNGYSCADSARIVRGIEAYHVRSKGWNDIGYNFLVDKCGTLFEGRRGGEGEPVLGAHTLGFNSRSAAIAVIGNYQSTPVSATVRNVIAQVAAYKIGMYGNLATERTVLVSSGSDRYAAGTRATLNRISGHRDTGRTECPGDALYAQLPSIRALAAAGPANFGLARLNGAVRVGSGYYTRGTLRPLWNTSTPSGLMNRFDVFVDGRLVVSAPRSNRTTLLSLGGGRHILTVRAVHLSGRIATTTSAVYSDAIAPTYTASPSVRLRTGSLNGSVPVRLLWAAADRGGLRSVTLSSPTVIELGPTAHTWASSVRPDRPTTWTLRAADRTGNVTTASTARTAMILPEAAATRTGSWATLSSPAFLSGAAMHSRAAGSSLSWTFTGSSAALAVSRTTASGRIRVYVDGNDSGVLDLRSATTQNRQAVWARSWSQTAQHTVRFVVEGTTGRPGVVLDGLVYLR